MDATKERAVVLGPEHDERLRRALKEVLASLGGSGSAHDWGVFGSQELETLEVDIDGSRIRVEAETYVGLSIAGPVDLIEKIQAMVRDRMAR